MSAADLIMISGTQTQRTDRCLNKSRPEDRALGMEPQIVPPLPPPRKTRTDGASTTS